MSTIGGWSLRETDIVVRHRAAIGELWAWSDELFDLYPSLVSAMQQSDLATSQKATLTMVIVHLSNVFDASYGLVARGMIDVEASLHRAVWDLVPIALLCTRDADFAASVVVDQLTHAGTVARKRLDAVDDEPSPVREINDLINQEAHAHARHLVQTIDRTLEAIEHDDGTAEVRLRFGGVPSPDRARSLWHEILQSQAMVARLLAFICGDHLDADIRKRLVELDELTAAAK